jgi:hypothetical protein
MTARVRGRRLWLRAQAHGHAIPVYVVKAPLFDPEDPKIECDAYYNCEEPVILVRQMDNVDLMRQRLHHELLHVCFGAHSGDSLDKVFGAHKGRGKREEDVCSFLEPIQYDLLVRNGWLKYPKPPRVK